MTAASFSSHVQCVHVQLFINVGFFSFLNTKAKGNAVAGMDEDLKHSK